jgi:threonine/homoserine/homoserine lactone efflux protein
MNLKLKAALQTAGILVVTSTIAVGIQLLFTTLTAKELTNILAVGSITFLIYCMYQVVLSRLEYEQKVEEIAKK